MNKIIKIEIEVSEDTGSDIADILCFLHGYIEGRGDEFALPWLKDSMKTLSNINSQIKSKNSND